MTSIPLLHTSPGWFHYWAFVSIFSALEACHVPWEETVIFPDMSRCQREQGSKFIAEKNLIWDSEGVQKHISTIANEESLSQDQMGYLPFDPNPPSNDVEDQAALEADDKKVELICWRNCLRHLSFDRLWLLAKLGEIPKYCVLESWQKTWPTKLSQNKGRHIFKAETRWICIY